MNPLPVTLAALCTVPCCVYCAGDGLQALGRVRRRRLERLSVELSQIESNRVKPQPESALLQLHEYESATHLLGSANRA